MYWSYFVDQSTIEAIFMEKTVLAEVVKIKKEEKTLQCNFLANVFEECVTGGIFFISNDPVQEREASRYFS